MSDDEQPQGPALSVVRGNPDDVELAAIVAAVVGLAGAAAARKPHAPQIGTLSGGWKSYWRVVRSPLHPGNEAWRSSFRI